MKGAFGSPARLSRVAHPACASLLLMRVLFPVRSPWPPLPAPPKTHWWRTVVEKGRTTRKTEKVKSKRYNVSFSPREIRLSQPARLRLRPQRHLPPIHLICANTIISACQQAKRETAKCDWVAAWGSAEARSQIHVAREGDDIKRMYCVGNHIIPAFGWSVCWYCTKTKYILSANYVVCSSSSIVGRSHGGALPTSTTI